MEAARKVVHPLWVRMTHWINAASVVVMIMSGLRIYNASPFFNFIIPDGLTLGGWLGGALLWHFAAMWLVIVNGSIYLMANLASGRFAARFLPIVPREIVHELADALHLRLAHTDLRTYNGLQRAAYLAVWCDIVVLVLSGLVLWKSVQFPLLRELVGGYEGARRVHFLAMSALVAFFAIHLAMVAIVPRTLVLMLRGR